MIYSADVIASSAKTVNGSNEMELGQTLVHSLHTVVSHVASAEINEMTSIEAENVAVVVRGKINFRESSIFNIVKESGHDFADIKPQLRNWSLSQHKIPLECDSKRLPSAGSCCRRYFTVRSLPNGIDQH